MASSASERTEQPTPRRLRDARRKGQVAVSRDFATACGFAIALAALVLSLPDVHRRFAEALRLSLASIERGQELDIASAVAALDGALWSVLALSLPIGVAAMLGGTLSTLIQTQALVSGSAFAPKPERFNPINGLKRMVALRTFVELAKTWTRLVAVAAAATFAIAGEGLRGLIASSWSAPGDAMLVATRISIAAALAVAVASFIIGGTDVLLQRWLHARDLRMTKDEVRRDHKEEEGDPNVKHARKQIHRELALSTMLQSTRTANFVAVNPTHLAVAVSWDEERDEAPRIVAKGSGEVALRIRREAERFGVRVVRNMPLARALFGIPVEVEIPEVLYIAVAETLAFVADHASDHRIDSIPSAGDPGTLGQATATGSTKARLAASRSLRGIPEADDPA